MMLILPLTALLAASPCPCPASPATALNLDWSSTDANGFPRNPWWVAQRSSDACIDPSSDCLCGGFPTKDGVPNGKPACTDQGTADLPGGVHKLICMLEWFRDGRRGVTRGHINWFPVSVTGHAWFDHESGADDDVNFELVPDTRAPGGGVPGQTAWNPGAGAVSRPDSLHVEMKKSETLDHLSQRWWKQLAEADTAAARSMVKASRALVIGLFGLDAEHKGHTELHPAYALAFRTACRVSGKKVDETWSVFLRNYGNEGWCSRWDEWHHLALDNNALVLQLPLRSGARKVALAGTPEMASNRTGVKLSLLPSTAGTADLQLAWPALAPTDELRVHGEVRLAFETTARDHCASPASLVLPEGAAPEHRAGDELADELVRRATPSSVTALRAGVAPDVQVVTVGAVTPGPARRTGPCPGGAATCDDAVRARAKDAFFPRTAAGALAAAALTQPIDDALCAEARELLAETLRMLESRAAQPGVNDPEGLKLRRLESLVAMCEVEEGAE